MRWFSAAGRSLAQHTHASRAAALDLSPARFGCSFSYEAMCVNQRATWGYLLGSLGALQASKTATSACEGVCLDGGHQSACQHRLRPFGHPPLLPPMLSVRSVKGSLFNAMSRGVLRRWARKHGPNQVVHHRSAPAVTDSLPTHPSMYERVLRNFSRMTRPPSVEKSGRDMVSVWWWDGRGCHRALALFFSSARCHSRRREEERGIARGRMCYRS